MSSLELFTVISETVVVVSVIGVFYGKQIYKAIENSLNN